VLFAWTKNASNVWEFWVYPPIYSHLNIHNDSPDTVWRIRGWAGRWRSTKLSLARKDISIITLMWLIIIHLMVNHPTAATGSCLGCGAHLPGGSRGELNRIRALDRYVGLEFARESWLSQRL